MSTVFALLVGIDAYRAAPPLRGCRNDIADVHAFLTDRVDGPSTLDTRVLLDGAATRSAVVDGLRSHVGRAGTGDTALFWFSGHGSCAPLPSSLWFTEPDRLMQTLVCADSRADSVPDLYDKEIWLLLGDAAERGAHVVAVVDSCHSGGATRDPRVRVRAAPRLSAPPDLGPLVPELVRRTVAGGPRTVSLAACQPAESAYEMPLDGAPHGLFSWALLGALRRSATGASYREVLAAARRDVGELTGRQTPRLAPVAGELADTAFLGGAVRSRPATITMSHRRGAWQLDAGACHGMPVADGTSVAVAGTGPLRECRVVRVDARSSAVEPLGWRPDPERGYPVVLSRVAAPATRIGPADPPGDAPTVARVLDAVGRAGPGGRPSAHLARAGTDAAEPPNLTLHAPVPGVVQIRDADGIPVRGPIDTRGDGGLTAATEVLDHLARWRSLRSLANPVSPLANAVTIELVPTGGAAPPSPTGPALRPDPADGAIHLAYHRAGGVWTPPAVHIRLRNTTTRRLYCVLLDLTDGFGAHAELFDGAFVAAGATAAALAGQPVEFRLPDERAPVPGAATVDWLSLVVAPDEFSVEPFEMAAIGEPPPPRRRRRVSGRSILDRIAADRLPGTARVRDAVIAGHDVRAGDWATTLVRVVTAVPAPRSSGGGTR